MSETFVLRQRPPLRALLISSIGALVAAVLLVVGAALSWPAAAIALSAVLLVFSILFGVLALFVTRGLDTSVRVDEEGYAISRPRHRAEGRWSDVDRVSMEGLKLTLFSKADPETGDSIVCLNGPDDPDLISLMYAIRNRLDADRGYHNLS